MNIKIMKLSTFILMAAIGSHAENALADQDCPGDYLSQCRLINFGAYESCMGVYKGMPAPVVCEKEKECYDKWSKGDKKCKANCPNKCPV